MAVFTDVLQDDGKIETRVHYVDTRNHREPMEQISIRVYRQDAKWIKRNGHKMAREALGIGIITLDKQGNVI